MPGGVDRATFAVMQSYARRPGWSAHADRTLAGGSCATARRDITSSQVAAAGSRAAALSDVAPTVDASADSVIRAALSDALRDARRVPTTVAYMRGDNPYGAEIRDVGNGRRHRLNTGGRCPIGVGARIAAARAFAGRALAAGDMPHTTRRSSDGCATRAGPCLGPVPA